MNIIGVVKANFLFGGICLLPSLMLCPLSFQALALAQTTSITSSGLGTSIQEPIGSVYGIQGGTRAGTNLFHSFGEFSIGSGHVAEFQTGTIADASLANILGRVTGGNPSSIFGTIDSATFFPSANLFLMNPAGVIFGPNATLNVGGMAAFTTADYLKLTDGRLFRASPNATADALLSTAPVAAFGFLGSNPSAITVQGSQLTVNEGAGISLVGGDITVQAATLSAPGGHINLASVASPGEIMAGTLDQASNITGRLFESLGTISVSEQSLLDAGGNGGGTVKIRGGNFALDNSTITANVTGPGPITNGMERIGSGVDIEVAQNAVVSNGGLIDTTVTGNATPSVTYGGVNIEAERIEILGSEDFDNFPVNGIFSNVAHGSFGGSSGNIRLQAASILVRDVGAFSAVIMSETGGAGNSGNIVLQTTGNLRIDGPVFITTGSLEGASGNAGNIEMASSSGDILITNSPFITSQSSSLGAGGVGSIGISAPNGDIRLTGSPEFGPAVVFTHMDGTGSNAGKGGISLTARNLTIENSGIQIDNFTPFQPGALTVTLTDTLIMRGADIFPSTLLTTTRRDARSANLDITAPHILLTENSLIATETFRDGDAGTLNIFTDDLEINGGAQVSSSSLFNPFPFPGDPIETPAGDAGSVTVRGLASTARSILIDGEGSGIFTDTQGTGAGGNINILTQSLTVQNGGTLSAVTSGTASTATGGAITVNGNAVTLDTGGTMTATTTGQGAAGQIDLQGLGSPAQLLSIDGAGSGIYTDTYGTGRGGNIFVDANAVTVQNGGRISALTSGTDASAIGGTITVNGNQVQVNSGGLITAATTGLGEGGSININAANTFSSNAGAVTTTASEASGGDIHITGGQSVTLTNGASISASSTGVGDAGNIHINAGQNYTSNQASVTTEAAQASGGNITIIATDTVRLTDSEINASVEGSSTTVGGNIIIDPNFVILQNSQILAQAIQGQGGNISITTNTFLPDANSVVSASSQFGVSGTVNIQSPISQAGGKLSPLPNNPLINAALVSQRCQALAQSEMSSFTVAGRDTLPMEPGGWLTSPLASVSPDGVPAIHDDGPLSSLSDDSSLVSLRRLPSPWAAQLLSDDVFAGCGS